MALHHRNHQPWTITAQVPTEKEDMKHNCPDKMWCLDDILNNTPCLKYWRRLYKKNLSDVNLRQEEIALFGYFKVYTPKECARYFNVSLGYVYKLIQALRGLAQTDVKVIGQMLRDHTDVVARIVHASPEAAALLAHQLELDALERRAREREQDHEDAVVIDMKLLHRFILTLALECQSSKENIHVCLLAVFGISISPSQIGDIIDEYARIGREKAKELDILVFPSICAIALDEIFQGRTPIFTIVDLDSTYSILIKPREDRKAETWEEELEPLRKLGLNPKTIVSDACGSILLAAPETFEDAVIMIDVFHVLKDLGDCIRQFIRKVEKPKTEAENIWKNILAGVNIQGKTWRKLEELEDEIIPYIDMWVAELEAVRGWIIELVGWSGYTCRECKELIEWCLDELSDLAIRPMKVQVYSNSKRSSRDCPSPYKLTQAVDKFRGHKERTMEYLSIFFQKLESRAEESGISYSLLEQAYRLHRYIFNSNSYLAAKRKACLEQRCSWQEMTEAEEIVSAVIAVTPRASSLVENLNSRIRPTLSKRKNVSADFLELKRLYLNLRPYKRSRKDERVGKSPYELITGDGSLNFFALLGLSLDKPAVIAG